MKYSGSQKKTLVVVDDDEFFALSVQSIIDELKLDFKIEAFYRPEELIDALNTVDFTISIFLIDYALPGISGFSLADYLRAHVRYSCVPRILASSRVEPEWLEASVFHDSVGKPINIDELANKLDYWSDQSMELGINAPLALNLLEKNYYSRIRVEKKQSNLPTADRSRKFAESDLDSPVVIDAVVGFLDLRQFSSISNSLQPDQLWRMLQIYFSVVSEVLEKDNCSIDAFIGDAVLWYFDITGSKEDAVFRSIETSRKLVSSMTAINETVIQSIGYNVKLSAGIGLSIGTIMKGELGRPKGRRQSTIIGSAVNLASRMCSIASSGEVVVGGEIVHFLSTSKAMQSGSTASTSLEPVKGFPFEVRVARM